MKKEVFRTISLRFTIILISGFLLFGYGYYNLKSNSVYYAKNTPHKEGTEPVLMMVVDNMDWIYTPEIDDIEYRFDGVNTIYNHSFTKITTPAFVSFGGGNYAYLNNLSEFYTFNILFESKKDINKCDINNIKQEIYKIVQPVIDAQSKPRVNLQWLFDIVYKDKFN